MSSITIRLPPEMISTNSVSTRPMPVSVTVPTMMPAAAVAMPMPIMLRAPVTSPLYRSLKPRSAAPPTSPVPRNSASSGRWVTRMKAMKAVAQNADSAGESSSTIRFQISATTGSRKYSPVFSVGPVSGSSVSGALGSSMCSSGWRDEYHSRPR